MAIYKDGNWIRTRETVRTKGLVRSLYIEGTMPAAAYNDHFIRLTEMLSQS